jgi:hypothetical protein
LIAYIKLNDVKRARAVWDLAGMDTLHHYLVYETLENTIDLECQDVFIDLMKNTKVQVCRGIATDENLNKYVPAKKMLDYFKKSKKEYEKGTKAFNLDDYLGSEEREEYIEEFGHIFTYGVRHSDLTLLKHVIEFANEHDLTDEICLESTAEIATRDSVFNVELIHLLLSETNVLTAQDLTREQLEQYGLYLGTLFNKMFTKEDADMKKTD